MGLIFNANPVGLLFLSEKFGEVRIEDVPVSTPPVELVTFLDEMKAAMGIPLLEMRYISTETAKRYINGLSFAGFIGCAPVGIDIICVVETEVEDKLAAMKSLMIHEAVHVLGYYHSGFAEVVRSSDGKSSVQHNENAEFDFQNRRFHELLNCEFFA